MEEKKKSKKGLIALLVILAAAAVAGIFLWKHFAGKEEAAEGEKAYVDTVANWTGAGSGLGVVNRFAGVVESQETWSVNQNPDATVAEIHVTVGQEVKTGDPLFTYDVEAYEATLEQQKIDLERLQNELYSIDATIEQLKRDQQKATSSEKADYTIRIQEQELSKKQKELEIRSKEQEIAKTEDNMKNATVKSEIDGVIKSINKGTNQDMYNQTDTGFITVMKTGDLRIKGSVNEQNMASVSVGTPMLVHSRADDRSWSGMVSKIDTENAQSGQNAYYGGDSGLSSSKYPFYVDLDDSTGLMMGQHVYLEPDYGQGAEQQRTGIWLDGYFIDQSNPAAPFVWADNGKGKIEKRAVTLGEYDEMMDQYQITSGLELTDSIAMPAENLTEGMPTGTMEEYYEAMMNGDFDVPDGGFEEPGAEELVVDGSGEMSVEENVVGGSGEEVINDGKEGDA